MRWSHCRHVLSKQFTATWISFLQWVTDGCGVANFMLEWADSIEPMDGVVVALTPGLDHTTAAAWIDSDTQKSTTFVVSGRRISIPRSDGSFRVTFSRCNTSYRTSKLLKRTSRVFVNQRIGFGCALHGLKHERNPSLVFGVGTCKLILRILEPAELTDLKVSCGGVLQFQK
ncbi:hypothetical protein BDW22DRAFT_1044587 [Trametopsis cervina]|nr:hypothetical protein BDW22DRAFT_1044587 [Trametopsis cervina]